MSAFKKRELTTETYRIFGKIYGRGLSDNSDLHTEFAEALEVDRQVAKDISYQILYCSKFFKPFLDAYSKELFNEYITKG